MAEATKRGSGAAAVARRYFAALAERDLDAALECWAPDGVERVPGAPDGVLRLPDEYRTYFGGVFAAFPDLRIEVLDTVAQDDRCAVRYRMSGTFAGAPFQGIAPTGARVQLDGCDVFEVRDGLIHRNDAFFDQMELARQLGALPPAGSAQERGMTAALNARTRLARRFAAAEPERIAEGVWVVRGGMPRTMNVYLIEDGEGVTVFDAGTAAMTTAIATAGAALGGITRVVLGHGHADHRGAAAGLGVPVHCHAAEVSDAEGDGGLHYFDLSRLERRVPRAAFPRLLAHWDGGPVRISETVAEGDDVAGFRVIHLPGHAPGLIGLWRESDRLALVSDCFYTLAPQTGIKGGPRVPHAAFNLDTEQARASMRKLASLEPATAWSGHADPLVGDVRAQLERAADET
jgi:glyoxylase-like metal-dependent hydrolase (beta-lactamase superfamily II)/predicted ester cyclase